MTNGNFPIGFSDVPLVKSVLEEKREFLPSEAEWKARNEVQIIRQGSATETNETTVYTVPDGKQFFLTNLFLNVNEDGGTSNMRGEVEIRVGSTVKHRVMEMDLSNGARISESATMNLSMPIKMFSGESVVADATSSGATANGNVKVSIVGWEEFKEVSPTRAAPQ